MSCSFLTSENLDSFRIPSKEPVNYEGLQDREKVEEVVRGRKGPPIVEEPQPDAWQFIIKELINIKIIHVKINRKSTQRCASLKSVKYQSLTHSLTHNLKSRDASASKKPIYPKVLTGISGISGYLGYT